MTLLFLAQLAVVAQVEADAQKAMAALRTLQTVEAKAYADDVAATKRFEPAPSHWSLVQGHQPFLTALAVARECLADAVAHVEAAKDPKAVPPQLVSLLRHDCRAIETLDRLVNTGSPKALQQAMATADKAFDKLLAHFPVGEFDEHPPKR